MVLSKQYLNLASVHFYLNCLGKPAISQIPPPLLSLATIICCCYCFVANKGKLLICIKVHNVVKVKVAKAIHS